MQKKISVIVLALISANICQVKAQDVKKNSTFRRCFIGSSGFILSNLVPQDNPPHFYQLNVGYWLTR